MGLSFPAGNSNVVRRYNKMVEEDRLLSARVTLVETFCFGLRNRAK